MTTAGVMPPGNPIGGVFQQIREPSFDRQQAEADHIGVFLMTFAGYDPRQAVIKKKCKTQRPRAAGP